MEKVTGTKKDRTEFIKLLDQIRQGDKIIVSELTRLSRSTKELFPLVEVIEQKGANIKSLKESWLDTTTPQGKLMFTIFAGISQFERDLTAIEQGRGFRVPEQEGEWVDDQRRKTLKSSLH